MQTSTEIRVGIFVIAVVALGLFAATTLKGGFGGRASGYLFEIWFEEAPGLGKGSPVRLAGVEIGQVVDKDIIEVTETGRIQVTQDQSAGLLPYELITTWSSGLNKDRVDVMVGARRLAPAELATAKQYERKRHVARLQVRVQRSHELFTRYRYEILGGIVFGDRQLNISDTGRDGLPLSTEERGLSIVQLAGHKQRVAVLGLPPANIDAIVGSAQKIMDEETALRIKNIIASIDRATDEAGEMLGSLRATIQANQGNADTMMKNLAAASGHLNEGLVEARGKLVSIMGSAQGATTAAQRLVEHNEARANHIMTNVEDTTTRIAAMAKDNQKLANQTMQDVAGTAKDVRSMVADTREQWTGTLDHMTRTAGNIETITGDARDKVGSILDKLDDTTGRIRDVIRDSDQHLRQATGDAAAITANAREMTDRLKGDLPEITGNLKTTSQNAAEASAKVRDLVGDPSTKQILANTEAATAEARALIADIRRITSDPKLQNDVKDAAASVKEAAAGVASLTGRAGSFKPTASLTAYYGTRNNKWESDIRLGITAGKRYSYHLFMDHLTTRPQYGVQLGRTMFSTDLLVRYGFYRGKLAIGADWAASRNGAVRLDVFDPGDPKLNVRYTQRIPAGLSLFVGLDDILDRPELMLGAQLGSHSGLFGSSAAPPPAPAPAAAAAGGR